jgi:hypothetical protein
MDDELRELQDPAEWDFEQADVVSAEDAAGGVVMVRFSAEDFSRVAKQAGEAKLTLAAFVREAVLDKVLQRTAR